MNQLENKRIIILGGSRGIGWATVIECLKQGALVGATYHKSQTDMETLSELAESLGSARKGGAFFSAQMDITDERSVKQAMKLLMDELGGIDVLINSAGITADRAFAFLDKNAWEQVIQTNLTGPYQAIHNAVLPMVAQKNGVILNVGSVSGIVGVTGQANYAASKAGLIGLTKSLSKELGAYNVRVNTVAPGYVKTEITDQLNERKISQALEQIPLKRFAEPEEIAHLLAFLASDQASYINGQTIIIDGGLTA